MSKKKAIKIRLRFFLHKVLSGSFRQAFYRVPYSFFIHRFMRNIDIDSIPLFSYIEIETLNRCNGTCSFCPVNALEPQRPYVKMRETLFKKIIDELGSINYSGEIHLFSNNEPFLDERITEFARYTRETVPSSYISIYTNGTLLDINKAKKITQYIDLLVIDNYDNNIINDRLKIIYDACSTDENLNNLIQFDMRKSNEILSSRGGQAPNKKKTVLTGVKRGCIYPFKQMVIRPDGKCSLCCNDALGKYTLGDLNNNTLMNIWYSDKYKAIRQSMIDNGRLGLDLCKNCDTHYFDKT